MLCPVGWPTSWAYENASSHLYSHFVRIEPFHGAGFDWAICLIGSGALRLVIPMPSTHVINQFLGDGWSLCQTMRLGRRGHRLFVDLLFDQPRPAWKADGAIVGMDANYKACLVFSDGQVVGQAAYATIHTFPKRKKQTHATVKSLIGHALKQIDFTSIRLLCIEDLKSVKACKWGTFPRTLNRRLSHWLYAYIAEVLARRCEEHGVRLERKNPWRTSQFCRHCRRWDRRSRKGDRFLSAVWSHSYTVALPLSRQGGED